MVAAYLLLPSKVTYTAYRLAIFPLHKFGTNGMIIIGKIVANGLHGEELDKKLAELLK